MAKKSKKRNKKYTGWDAKDDDKSVTVHKVAAVNRSPIRQWLHDHKKLVRFISIALLVVIGIILIFTVRF